VENGSSTHPTSGPDFSRTAFTTTGRGINRDSFPFKLYEKAKKLGTWNPTDLDFSGDREDWLSLADPERDVLLRLASLFAAGEEAVTLDLLPLIMAVAGEGRLEEEMFLTTFLFEEAKHTDFFNRFLVEVAGHTGGLAHFHSPAYRQIFYEALPQALGRLVQDRSPAAQVIASATYNMIVEGVLAETGYHAFFTIMETRDILPGTRKGVVLLQQDESRHIAYGVYLLSRLIAEDSELWPVMENQMNVLLVPAMNVISEIFAQYDPMPFELQEAEFAMYAANQFAKRMERIEGARE